MAKDALGHGSEARGGTGTDHGVGGAPRMRLSAHGTGVDQIGKSPLNRSAVLGAYNRNENNNAHSENVALLAKHFGTPEEHAMAREIISERNKQGSLPDHTKSVPNVRDWQYAIHKNYSPLLYGNKR